MEDEKGNLEWLIRKDGCMHCEDPGCLKACPAPGAIVQYANGIVDFISENCIGCGYCVKGCPFDIPRISPVDHKSYKCTLCSDRVGVGLEPACVKACPTGAIMFGSKTDMTAWAGERIVDLKSRGFSNAGLYDPPEVGGTHVMYVLHHADKPSIYAACRTSRASVPLVDAWKGILKPLALAGIAFTAVAGFFHWVLAGPKKCSPRMRPKHGGCCIQRTIRDDASKRNVDPQHGCGRINHWITGGCFVLLLLSGLAMFHPLLFFLSELFRRWRMDSGRPSMDRDSADGELCRTDRAVLARQSVEPDDIVWVRAIDRVLANKEEGVPEVARFNAGQKFVFWSMALLVPVLFVTGLVIWDVYFSPYTTIEQQRIAVLDPQSGRSSGDHRLDHPCLCRDLGERVGAGHDAGLCDTGLGLAAPPQVGLDGWRRPAPLGRGRAREAGPRDAEGGVDGGLPGGVKAPDALILPDPVTKFGRTSARLDSLSVGHPMEEWLRFMARLAKAQHAPPARSRPLPVRDQAAVSQAVEARLPPLAADSHRRDPRWRDALAMLLDEVDDV